MQGLFGTKADTKPLIVGSGGLPFTTIEQLETEAGGRLNLDDFIALTLARVAICKNTAAQKTMSEIIQRRNYLRTLLDGNLAAEARGVIQEIAAEVNAVAAIIIPESSAASSGTALAPHRRAARCRGAYSLYSARGRSFSVTP